MSSESRLRLTYDDYVRIPDDGRRHEIIDGEHHVSPAPRVRHQAVLMALAAQLHARVVDTGLGVVLPAPTDLLLSDHDIVQPDILVVLRERARLVTEPNVVGPPDLAVEILSPSTERLDRHLKLRLFERSGVAEYWIIDADRRVVEQRVLEDGRFRLACERHEEVRLERVPEVVVDLTRVW